MISPGNVQSSGCARVIGRRWRLALSDVLSRLRRPCRARSMRCLRVDDGRRLSCEGRFGASACGTKPAWASGRSVSSSRPCGHLVAPNLDVFCEPSTQGRWVAEAGHTLRCEASSLRGGAGAPGSRAIAGECPGDAGLHDGSMRIAASSLQLAAVERTTRSRSLPIGISMHLLGALRLIVR